ncbi:DinB family protein [Spirosoma pollinicola]|uniref:DinB family protein n=1 Tax=Spirosoma pollinicola TaxID=2057025 RepID=A0A2K8YT63_9BACT|nr:DinB family protein [Spirosoma pollinicola]AUD00800.1 DinB family protein [Spirosoma pollinicola]
MTETQMLINQTDNAYQWVNKLVESVPLDKWTIIPPTVESSIDWQLGHLIISHYFHSIMVIRGHQMDILQQLPIRDYSELFTAAGPSLSIGKVDSVQLIADLQFMQQKSLAILATLETSELDDLLEPTHTPHPIATTKREAVDWNIKHTMYHCGQIGLIKRVVDERHDFGLRLAK